MPAAQASNNNEIRRADLRCSGFEWSSAIESIRTEVSSQDASQSYHPNLGLDGSRLADGGDAGSLLPSLGNSAVICAVFARFLGGVAMCRCVDRCTVRLAPGALCKWSVPCGGGSDSAATGSNSISH